MRRIVLMFALAAGMAAPAAAQPAPWEPERFDAGWIFRPAVVFGGMWDSNVTLRNNPTGDTPTIAELVGIVSPRGELDFNGRRAKFNAGYSGRLETYRELTGLSKYDQRGRVEARYTMTPRLTFETRHQFSATPTTDQIDLSGLPFVRVGSRILTSGGGFTAALTQRTKLVTQYMFQWVDFDRDPRFQRLKGGHQHNPTVELRYQVSRRLDVGANTGYHHATINGAEQVVDTMEANGIVQYTVGPKTFVRGSAGVAYLQSSRTDESESGPSVGVGLTQRIQVATVEAGFERSFVPSFGFGGMTAVRQMYARAQVPFARGRMSLSGGIAYRKNTPVLANADPIELDTYVTSASFGYAATRWLRIESFLAVHDQTSSAEGNIERTRVGIQFVTFKPMRIQ